MDREADEILIDLVTKSASARRLSLRSTVLVEHSLGVDNLNGGIGGAIYPDLEKSKR